MDIGGWLRNIGLERYEAAFRESAIDQTVLPSLTAEDLKDLGVGIVGHRRKLLDAIAALRADANASTPDRLAINDRSPEPKTEDRAERRQVTVLFSDLVGSTALSAHMDPEDLREVVSTYHKCVAETMRQFDGFVAQYMGDGALVYFGYPQAHEDDVERATQAGLELIAAVVGLKTHAALQTRVGIATGLVIVGYLIGSGEAQQRGIMGETPNLAARLQGIAEPNMVVIDESTRRLLGDFFELQDLGPRQLKGVPRPTRAWAVLGASSVANRFEALHATGLTALVGREEETELLLRRWSRAKAGEGQVISLSGEAGIGKSRLTVALLERLAGEPHTCLRYFCSPQHTDRALHPIIGQIERAAGLAHDDTPQASLDKLDALLALTSTPIQDAALFAETLSLPNDGRYPVIDLAPQQRRQRTLEALDLQMGALARQTPVLMIFEDAHWADPTSLELFGRVVDRIVTLRMLLIVTFRPEFEPPWSERPYVRAFTINRLAQREVSVLIDRIAGSRPLPANIRQDIIERTDGIPLFVEEMTKAVLEAESEGEVRRAAAAIPSPTLSVPTTLHASLMARLDRLGPAKEVAQIGAVIGREFSHALLAAVVRKPEMELGSVLDRLIQAGLLFRQGTPPRATYLFKHALVRDAAYGTLLREPRHMLHARIAETLENHFPAIADSQPETLARHCAEAGLVEPATRHWVKAAELALSRSALAEAGRYVEAGLACNRRLTDGPDRQSLELTLQLVRANVLLPLKGYTQPETVAALTAAKRLFDAGVGTDLQRFSLLFGLYGASVAAAQLESALALAHQIVEFAERQDDATYRLLGYRLLGTMQLYTGHIREALESLQQAERYRDPDPQRLLAFRFGGDPDLLVLGFKILALMLLGLHDEAARDGEQVLAVIPSHRHPNTVASCTFLTVVWPVFLFGDLEACERHSAELVAYCAEKKLEQFRLFSAIFHAYAKAMREPTEENIATIQGAIEAEHQSGARIFDSVYLSQLAEVLLMAGDVTGAEAAVQEGLIFVEQSGERFWLAELHRLDGRVALKRVAPDRERAATCFLRSIEIACGQGARFLELRAANDLARLWRDTGSHSDPRALLEPVLAAMEGGETARDVRDASALLGESASRTTRIVKPGSGYLQGAPSIER
jgi:class 3 adenylate cyclase/tetratricopeptide (TPR) repeat protein